MQMVPFLLGLVLIVLGVIVRLFQKSVVEKWVGYNVASAGILIIIETLLGELYPELAAQLPAISLVTLIIVCVVMIIGFGRYRN